MPRTKDRRRRDRGHTPTATALRGTAAVLASVVVAATAAPTASAGAPDAPGTPQVPGSQQTESVSATLDSLQRRAVELRQRVLETYTAYQQAQSHAAKLRAEYARATEVSDNAVRYADRLYSQVSGRSAIPGLDRLLDMVGHGDPELDDAVAAAKAQEAAMKTVAAAQQASEAADRAVPVAKASWTDAAALGARLDVRIKALAQGEESLRLARFHSSYQVPVRVQDLRNRAALENWRAYLTALADARIVPPTASALANPETLRAPLQPVLDKAGKPIPGVAQVWRVGADPLIVLPAETIRVVSKAFSRVGRPDADAYVGADAYACGGLTRDVWRSAGELLPRSSVKQFETLAKVDRHHLQVGDLVYIGSPPYGISRAGVNLGGGQWIAVTAATGQVVVEPLPSAALYGVRRVTLPAPEEPTPAPKGLAGYTKIGCGEVKAPQALAQGGVTGPTTTDLARILVSTSGAALAMPVAEGTYQLSAEFGAAGNMWIGGRHTGQDFAAKIGTPVRAALAGVVTVEHPAWAGNLVRIDHGNGLETWYAHLSAVAVVPGRRVDAGTVIGAVGTEGNSTGPHLHFEVRVDGQPVDPLPLLMPSTSMARWGGFRNGMIPATALCALEAGSGQFLRCDAAVAFRLMDSAFSARFGRRLSVSDSYRSLSEQQALFTAKPNLAAVPGTSNHGWGLAVDLAGGVEHFGAEEHQWMVANAPRFGWKHPEWARQGGSRPEPWHFEFGRVS
jgi:murein DD-endopeptidase MepM/ murein hydrolase activator NlpD